MVCAKSVRPGVGARQRRNQHRPAELPSLAVASPSGSGGEKHHWRQPSFSCRPHLSDCGRRGSGKRESMPLFPTHTYPGCLSRTRRLVGRTSRAELKVRPPLLAPFRSGSIVDGDRRLVTKRAGHAANYRRSAVNGRRSLHSSFHYANPSPPSPQHVRPVHPRVPR